MGVAFIQGMQGDDPKYLLVMACAKHFAVHSGPEALRHRFDVYPSERDLYETYLPHFEAAVREGHVGPAVVGLSIDFQSKYNKPAVPLVIADFATQEAEVSTSWLECPACGYNFSGVRYGGRRAINCAE